MPKRSLISQSKLKLFSFLCLVGVIGAVLIVLNQNGFLVSPAQTDFSNVVGMPAPPSVNMLKVGSTGFIEPLDWLSFTVSEADLLKIIKQGQFQVNWSMVPGLGPYPTPKALAHRGIYCTFSDGVNAPTWWKPAHQPNRYITYERSTEFEDLTSLRVLVVTPGSNVIYAVYSRPG